MAHVPPMKPIRDPPVKIQALQYCPYTHHGAKSQCHRASNGSGSGGDAPGPRLGTSTGGHTQLHRPTVSSTLGLRHATNLFGFEYTVRLDTTLHCILHSQVAWMGRLFVQPRNGMRKREWLRLDRHLRRRVGFPCRICHLRLHRC